MTSLHVTGLSVTLGRRTVLRDVTFSAEGGAFIGLVGPNGAGKSTLLKALAGILPHSGAVTLDEWARAALSRPEAARLVAYLAQGDTVHWPLSARTVIGLGRAPHTGPLARFAEEDAAAIARAMRLTGTEAFADRDVTTLSGGERARVLLARALATDAPILLADEPVGALDPRLGLTIMQLLREEVARGKLVIAVLHDLALASRFCDRLLMVQDGALVADGPPLDVLASGEIERHYAVRGHHGSHEDESFVIPWQVVEP